VHRNHDTCSNLNSVRDRRVNVNVETKFLPCYLVRGLITGMMQDELGERENDTFLKVFPYCMDSNLQISKLSGVLMKMY